MRLVFCLGIVVALLATIGCITPHRLEVQQGNVLTQEMLDNLKPGLTKSQVRFVLGTPLVTDPFHPERWDYVYVYKKHATAPAETRHLTVIFDGDEVARIEGDMAPTTGTAGDESSTGETARETEPLRPTSARTL